MSCINDAFSPAAFAAGIKGEKKKSPLLIVHYARSDWSIDGGELSQSHVRDLNVKFLQSPRARANVYI